MQPSPLVCACLAAAAVLPAACTAIHPAPAATAAPAAATAPAATAPALVDDAARAEGAPATPTADLAVVGPAPSLAASASHGTPGPQGPQPQALVAIAQFAGLLTQPTAEALGDRVLRLQLEARDTLRRAEADLTGLAQRVGLTAPDLTVLSTEPVARTESSGFGWRDDPIRHTRKFHSGTDFRGKPGTPVRAAGDGVVVFCGRLGGYGNVIDIDHGGGILTRYAHLRRFGTKKDAAVTAGTSIGEVGSTGRTTGPHLHFEVRIDGAPVSPIAAMTVATLQRESPFSGRLAALALAPELQSAAESTVDPPRQRGRATQRPERAGRGKRKQVLW